MKKTFSFCFILTLLTLVFSLLAQGKTYLNDNAGLLTSEQAKDLEQTLSDKSEELCVDIAVYTENAMTGSDAQSSAEGLFDSLDYGYGDNRDGILFYICMDERVYYIDTYGEEYNKFNEQRQIHIEDKLLPYLSDGDYYGAFTAFSVGVEEVAKGYDDSDENGNSYNQDDVPYYDDVYYSEQASGPSWLTLVVVLGIPALIAFIMTKVKQGKMKTALKMSGADNYVKDGSVDIINSRDVFLYSNLIKTPRPQDTNTNHNTSSGGFSSGGFSSGGHSGRGGSF